MKNPIIIGGLLACLVSPPMQAAEENPPQEAALDFGTFSPSHDGTFVEITVNSSLINMAARLAEDSEPEMARILSGLRSIRVNVMEFEAEEKTAVQSKIQAIRSRLDEQQWERVVTVKEEDEDVGIHVKLKGEESIEGVAVTVISGEEAVLVHVEGSLRPEELAQVGERLHLQPLARLGQFMDKAPPQEP